MVQSPFVWLGAGRARKRGVAEATALLDAIARAGLPVPSGAVLLDELYEILLAEGVIGLAGDRVIVPDAQWLLEVIYHDVRLPRLPRPVEVRAAAEGIPNTGALLDDFVQPEPAAAALRQVWSLPSLTQDETRRDVLVIEQVGEGPQGTAVLSPDAAIDPIHVGSKETGNLPGELIHLRAFQSPDSTLPPFAQRLQKLLRGLRRTLGDGEWRVSWADDGDICWVTAVEKTGAVKT